MTNWLYPETMQSVQSACNLFLSGQLDAEQLQTVLYRAEQEVQAIEENWLRLLLLETENKLEEIMFTVPVSQRAEAMSAIVDGLLTRLFGEIRAN